MSYNEDDYVRDCQMALDEALEMAGRKRKKKKVKK